jgi:hypothetical protein
VARPEERKKNPTRERLLTLRCLACGSVCKDGAYILRKGKGNGIFP